MSFMQGEVYGGVPVMLSSRHPVTPLSGKSILSLLSQHDVRVAGYIAAGAVVAGLAAWAIARSRRPSAEEVERRRRTLLAERGRITDGVIDDARTLSGDESMSPTPEVLVYRYELAGVTYHCAQDVSLLGEQVRGFRLDQPVQVRYEPRNPGNSVVVSEGWSGLRIGKPWAVGTDSRVDSCV
jgi:hypothetical protein